jgi:ATP-dependent HslUV protease ATP-binding subunit HslU
LLDLLLPPPPGHSGKTGFDSDPNGRLHYDQTREKFKQMLQDGRLDEREVDVDVAEKRPPMIDVVSGAGMEEMGSNIKDMLGSLMPGKTKKRKLKVPEAFKALC